MINNLPLLSLLLLRMYPCTSEKKNFYPMKQNLSYPTT
jgi:hypothetical protein